MNSINQAGVEGLLLQIEDRDYDHTRKVSIDFLRQHWEAASQDLQHQVDHTLRGCLSKMQEKLDRDFGHFNTVDQPDDKIIPMVNLSMVRKIELQFSLLFTILLPAAAVLYRCNRTLHYFILWSYRNLLLS